MKITRTQLRKMIIESIDDNSRYSRSIDTSNYWSNYTQYPMNERVSFDIGPEVSPKGKEYKLIIRHSNSGEPRYFLSVNGTWYQVSHNFACGLAGKTDVKGKVYPIDEVISSTIDNDQWLLNQFKLSFDTMHSRSLR